MIKRMIGLAAVLVVLTALGAAMTGCSGTKPEMNTLEDEIAARDEQINTLQGQIEQQDTARRQAEQEADRAKQEAENAVQMAKQEWEANADSGQNLLPPSAQPGECYARVLIPPVYESTTEQVVVKESSERVEVLPAQLEWAEEQVLVKGTSARLEVIPATYEWVEERVMVKPARKELTVVPAVYETLTEQVLVTPARTYWKKGRGPVEKLDDATGEIMCLVKEPAVYDTVTKRVLKTPESVRETAIPAEYTTVKRMVTKTQPTTRQVEIPAEYKTVRVRKEVKPASERRIAVPAEHGTVTKRQMVSSPRMEWRPVLCETNMGQRTIADIQRALDSAGFDPGPVDGRYGPLTRAAVRSFQESQKLPTGGLTLNTIKALGVQVQG